MGKAQTKASNKYHAEKYDRLYPFVLKGRKAEIQAAADRAGETLNEYIVNAVDWRMQHEPPERYKMDEVKAAIARIKSSSD